MLCLHWHLFGVCTSACNNSCPLVSIHIIKALVRVLQTLTFMLLESLQTSTCCWSLSLAALYVYCILQVRCISVLYRWASNMWPRSTWISWRECWEETTLSCHLMPSSHWMSLWDICPPWGNYMYACTRHVHVQCAICYMYMWGACVGPCRVRACYMY